MQICANGRSGQLTVIVREFPAKKLIRQRGFASKGLNYSDVKTNFNGRWARADSSLGIKPIMCT